MASSAHADPASLAAGQSKKFVCAEPSCGKAFARREHLHRHEFNHKDNDFTCPRCAAHFRRRDLLERHAQRHRQKDAEAGGEGLGNLATRKRLWKDSNGRVINSSRPHRLAAATVFSENTSGRQRDKVLECFDSLGGRQNNGVLEGFGITDGSQDDIVMEGFDNSCTRQSNSVVEGFNGTLPPPPASNPSTTSGQMNSQQGMDITSLQAPWPPIDMSFMPQTEGADLDFLSDSSWSNLAFQGLVGAPDDLPHNDVSFPDTTISFSTSLPTLQYYSWLFGNGSANADIDYSQSSLGPEPGTGLTHDTQHRLPTGSYDPTISLPSPPHQNGPWTAFNSQTLAQNQDRNTGLLSPESGQGATTKPSTARQSPVPGGNPSYLSPPSNSNQGGTSELGIIGLDSPHQYFSPSRPPDASRQPGISRQSGMSRHPDPNEQPNNFVQPVSHSPNPHNLPPPDSFVRKGPRRLPKVTDEARDGLMQLISKSRPTRPDKSEINSSDPLLSLSSLQHYSDLFFTCFNSTYPLIHPGTFNSSMVEPLLLMSIILLGASYGDKKAHLLAVCIHDIMRPLIHSSREFGPRPKLWMLQTILLVECFGKSRAGERQHDMSNIYHGLQINLLRRSDCHSASVPPWDETTQTLEEYWRLAIEAEEKRRLAMISFMWDTQHAIFFAQILCLNASEIKVTLPWDTAIWEADTAEEWLHLSRTSPAPQQYLSVLQMYTDPSVSSGPKHLNALSRVLIFHGLMSLSWDFRRRDQTALNRNITSTAVRWQTTISACYTKWKADFDRYTKDVLSSLSNDPAQRAQFQRYAVANSAVYHTAQLVLEVETADLQIHAGAKHIVGRPVTDLDRQRSRTRLNEFMTRDEGKSVGRATWHAARLIRDGVRKLDKWNVDEMIHFPWCLYLATLTCWTIYSTAVENCRDELQRSTYISVPLGGGGVDDEDNDDDWDAETDMKALISALTRLDPSRDTFAKEVWVVAEKYRPHGLLSCMVKHLSTIRWAVIREGMIVLKDLTNKEHGAPT